MVSDGARRVRSDLCVPLSSLGYATVAEAAAEPVDDEGVVELAKAVGRVVEHIDECFAVSGVEFNSFVPSALGVRSSTAVFV